MPRHLFGLCHSLAKNDNYGYKHWRPMCNKREIEQRKVYTKPIGQNSADQYVTLAFLMVNSTRFPDIMAYSNKTSSFKFELQGTCDPQTSAASSRHMPLAV